MEEIPSFSFITTVSPTRDQLGRPSPEQLEVVLCPWLVIHNTTAVGFEYEVAVVSVSPNKKLRSTTIVAHSGHLDAGGEDAIYQVPPGSTLSLRVRLDHVDFSMWSTSVRITGDSLQSTMQLEDVQARRLLFHVSNDVNPTHSRTVTVYCPYWIQNKTGLPLLAYSNEARASIAAGQFTLQNQMAVMRPGAFDREPRDLNFEDFFSSKLPVVPSASSSSSLASSSKEGRVADKTKKRKDQKNIPILDIHSDFDSESKGENDDLTEADEDEDIEDDLIDPNPPLMFSSSTLVIQLVHSELSSVHSFPL